MQNGMRNRSSRQRRDEETRISEDLVSRLASFKNTPLVDLVDTERQFFQGACAKCSPLSQGSLSNPVVKMRGIKKALERNVAGDLLYKPPAKLQSRSNFSVTDLNQRLATENESIKMTLQDMTDKCLDDVHKAVDQLKLTSPSAPKSWHERISNARAKYALAPNGVLFHPGEVEVLERCQRSGYPMIFVPLYQSSADTLLISRFLEEQNFCNRVVLQSNVKSEWKWVWDNSAVATMTLVQDPTDDLALLVERETILVLMKEYNENLIFHLQGEPWCGLNEMTKGLLQYMLEFVSGGEIEDIMVVPVSLSYEAEPEPKFSFWEDWSKDFLTVLRFDQPFNLGEFYASNYSRLRNVSLSSLTETTGAHILNSAQFNTRVMPNEIVAFLRTYDFGKTKFVSVEMFEEIVGEIKMKKKDLGFSGSSEDVLERAVSQLDACLQNQSLLMRRAENIVRIYALESIAVIALMSKLELRQPLSHFRGTHCSIQPAQREEVEKSAAVLLHFLKDRFFIHKPCQNVEHLMSEILDSLVSQDILVNPDSIKELLSGGGQHLQERTSRRLARQFDMENQEEDDNALNCGFQHKITFSVDHRAVDRIYFLCSLLSPHIYTFYQVVGALEEVLLHSDATENVDNFISKLQKQIEVSRQHYVPICLQRLENMRVISPRDDEAVISFTEEFKDVSRLQELRTAVYQFVM